MRPRKRSVADFQRISTEVFAPVYPEIARAAVKWSGIRKGTCLDIGCGTGLLARAMAAEGGFRVLGMDIDPEMLGFASTNLADSPDKSRVSLILGDVERLPLCDGRTDLVVSRGSLYFWKSRILAFREIFRILRPGGAAYVGGGFGNRMLKEQIFSEMRRRNPHWDEDVAGRSARAPPALLAEELKKSGIFNFEISEGESGIWVMIRKPA